MELHSHGALTGYLLPTLTKRKPESIEVQIDTDSEPGEYTTMGKGFHEKAEPEVLRVPLKCIEHQMNFHFYFLNFKPIPPDRKYREFGFFLTSPLPEEFENLEVDLCLTHRRIVKTVLVHSGDVMFDKKMILSALKFQEMFHKIIFDRSKFFSEFVSLGGADILEKGSSSCYLFLPVIQGTCLGKMVIDWPTVECCLSSPVFQSSVADRNDKAIGSLETLNLANGSVEMKDVIGSLVYMPHNKKIFFIDDIFYDINAHNQMKGFNSLTYEEHYIQKFNINLLHPTQPFLKAKELFHARNLLRTCFHDSKEVPMLEEHFVKLPPELCLLKIKGFTKEIGSSLSLFPSFMHRLKNLLLATQLKDIFSSSFPEGSEVSTSHILEALTTEKCLQGFSLERLEILGDAFLKYVIARHDFLLYGAIDEGHLTAMRSNIVNNSHLCELALGKNLQVYIQNEPFDPSLFFYLGPYSEATSQSQGIAAEDCRVEGKKLYRCLPEKTIADVVEALIGAFLVDSGFRSANAFLQWIGMRVDFDATSMERVCRESYRNVSVGNSVDWFTVERLLGYTFRHRGLLVQAFIHPSSNKHLGVCYQRLEFLGDAVLEYLITSYLYSAYPDLKPGQLSDLKSITLNNLSFAHIAVSLSLHRFLVHNCPVLLEAINKFTSSEKDLVNDSGCPKVTRLILTSWISYTVPHSFSQVLGDLVESCIGAVLLDSGFDLNCLWEIILRLFHPLLCSSPMQVNALRELRELCQSCHFALTFPDPITVDGKFVAEVIVRVKEQTLTFTSVDCNSKVARTMASRKALSKIKELGFSGKNKTLEELMQSTRKKDPELIGYDKAPMVTNGIEEMEVLLSVSSSSSSLPDLVHELDVTSHGAKSEKEVAQEEEREGVSSTTATANMKTPTMRLFEACAVNYWRRPIFSCYKEEGESHPIKFACKVSVEVDVANGTVIESFGDLKNKKQAAKDHAAEGALWCLRNMGLLALRTTP